MPLPVEINNICNKDTVIMKQYYAKDNTVIISSVRNVAKARKFRSKVAISQRLKCGNWPH